VHKTILLHILLLYIAGIPFDDDTLELNINDFKFRKTIQDVSSLSRALGSAVLIPVLFISDFLGRYFFSLIILSFCVDSARSFHVLYAQCPTSSWTDFWNVSAGHSKQKVNYKRYLNSLPSSCEVLNTK
jgi:hypothetical protein